MNPTDQVRCTCDPDHPLSYLFCIEHGPVNLQLSLQAEVDGTELRFIDPKTLDYDPGDEWAEGEFWWLETTEKDTSPPNAPENDKPTS